MARATVAWMRPPCEARRRRATTTMGSMCLSLLLLAAPFFLPSPPARSSESFSDGVVGAVWPSFLLPASALFLVRSNSSNIEASSPYFVFGVTEFALGGELTRASPVDACDRLTFNASGMVVWIEPYHCSIETKIRHCAAAGCLAAVSSSAYRIPGNEMWTQWEGAASAGRGLAADATDVATLGVPFVHVGREDANLLRLALTERELALKEALTDLGGGGRPAPTPAAAPTVASGAIAPLTTPTPTTEVILANLSVASLDQPSAVAHFRVFLSSVDSSNEWQQAYTSLYFTIFFQVMLGVLNVVVALVAMAKFKRYYSIRQARPFYANIPLVCLALLIASNLERGLYCFLDPMGATHTLPRGVRRVLLSASVPWTYASTLLLTFFWSEAISKRRNLSAPNDTPTEAEELAEKKAQHTSPALQQHLQGMSAAQVKQLQAARDAALKRIAVRAGMDSPVAARHTDREYAQHSRGGVDMDVWDEELVDLHAHMLMASPSPRARSEAHHESLELQLMPISARMAAASGDRYASVAQGLMQRRDAAPSPLSDMDVAGSGSEPCTPQVTQGLLSPHKRMQEQSSNHGGATVAASSSSSTATATTAASVVAAAATAPLVRKKSGSSNATPKLTKKHSRSSSSRRVGGAGEFDQPLNSDVNGQQRRASDDPEEDDAEDGHGEEEQLGSSLASTVTNIGDVVVEAKAISVQPLSLAERRSCSSTPPGRASASPVHVHVPLQMHAPMPNSSAHSSPVTLRISVPGRSAQPLPPPPPPAPPATPAPPAELCRAFLLAEQQYSARAAPAISHKPNLGATLPRSSSSYSGLGSVPLYMHLPAGSMDAAAFAPVAVGGGNAALSSLPASSAASSPRAGAAAAVAAAAAAPATRLPDAGQRCSSQDYRFVPVVSGLSSAHHFDVNGRDTPMTLPRAPGRRTPAASPSPKSAKSAHAPRPSTPIGQQMFLVRYQTAFILATLFLTALDLTFSLLDALYILDWQLLPMVEIVFAGLGVAVTAAYFCVSYRVLRRLKYEGEAKLAAAHHNFAQDIMEAEEGAGAGAGVAAGLAADDLSDWTARIGGLKTASQQPHLHLQHLQRPIAVGGMAGGMRSAQSSPALMHMGASAIATPNGVELGPHGAMTPGAGRSPRGAYRSALPMGSASSSPLVMFNGSQAHPQAQMTPHGYFAYPPAPAHHPNQPFHAYQQAYQQQHHSSAVAAAAAAASLASQRAGLLSALRAAHHNKVVRMWQFLAGSGVGLLLFLAVSLTSPHLWHTRLQTTLDDPLTTISRDFLIFLALFIVGACQVCAF